MFVRRIASLFALFFITSNFLHAKHHEAYDKFPHEKCHLHELKEKARELKKNKYKKALFLVNEFDRRTHIDPSILHLKQNWSKKHKAVAGKYHAPFDFNRCGRGIKGIAINASDAHIHHQHYILAECPRTVQEAADYYEAALAEKTVVFVSAHESTECTHRCHDFWKHHAVKKITPRDRSKIVYLGATTLIKDKKVAEDKKNVPQIVETDLLSSKKGAFTHIHIDGWHDANTVPSLALFSFLLDRIVTLSPDPSIPVAINCRGGAGRTGTIAVSLFLRREIDAQLAAGKSLDEIHVNIPEVIYQFRKERKGMVGNPQQLVQIYLELYAYYKRVKE